MYPLQSHIGGAHRDPLFTRHDPEVDMGTFHYGSTLALDIDDHTLAHVRSVVFAKLRGKEAFPLTVLRSSYTSGSGPISLWISPDAHVAFQFSDGAPEELSREWIEELLKSSYDNRGLVIDGE